MHKGQLWSFFDQAQYHKIYLIGTGSFHTIFVNYWAVGIKVNDLIAQKIFFHHFWKFQFCFFWDSYSVSFGTTFKWAKLYLHSLKSLNGEMSYLYELFITFSNAPALALFWAENYVVVQRVVDNGVTCAEKLCKQT